MNDRRHEFFKEEWRASRAVEIKVALWLEHTRNEHVLMPIGKLAPTYADRTKYSDQGDLFLLGEGGHVQIVEVKQAKRVHWTVAETFPYEVVTLMTKARWDGGYHPDMIITVNDTMTHAWIVMVEETRPLWRVLYSKDKRDGAPCEWYVIDAAYADFFHLD